MSKYTVSIPIAGAVHIEVEAESTTKAIAAAWDVYNDLGEKAGDVEWEAMDHITTGNVCHAPLNDVAANKHRTERTP